MSENNINVKIVLKTKLKKKIIYKVVRNHKHKRRYKCVFLYDQIKCEKVS